MRRNRIMNNGLYTCFRQILLQSVSLRTTDGKIWNTWAYQSRTFGKVTKGFTIRLI